MLKQLWSATEFTRDDVASYARGIILPDTRFGLAAMAVLMLCLQLGIWLLQVRMGQGEAYFYTFCILSALSLHVLVSSLFVGETRTLHLLAMAYLVMSGTAITLVAHQMGAFNIALMAATVLLIVSIPLVPWGLKEAVGISVLIYALFTSSTLSATGRFDAQTLWTLQFLFFSSALIAWVLVARNVRVRKHDIETRFDLEREQRRHERLSMTDPLTGAWNRRFLMHNFARIAESAHNDGQCLRLALLDVDAFKELNDTWGHHCGDEILKTLVRVLAENLPGTADVIRLGGDEFAILYNGEDLERPIGQCLDHLATDPKILRLAGGNPVYVSIGFASLADAAEPGLEELYRIADDRLYATKRSRRADSENNFASPFTEPAQA